MRLPLPELPGFDYSRASSAENALKILGGNAARTHVLLGGTDLFVQMRAGDISPAGIIDLKHIPEFNRIELEDKSGLTIGAAATIATAPSRNPATSAMWMVRRSIFF